MSTLKEGECHQQNACQKCHVHEKIRIYKPKDTKENRLRQPKRWTLKPFAQPEWRWQSVSIDLIDPYVRIQIKLHCGETQL